MLEQFTRYSNDNGLLRGGPVLLAVSGGVDSMVMAHIFTQLKIPCAIAHCNFSLRGKESDLDEKLVSQFANRHKIRFHSKRFDTKGFAAKNGISIQMAARELRYKWFEEIRSGYNYEAVAVAHNLNDNIETLLINLTRGTGISGLTGIKAATGNIIRPLLFASRKEIAEYSEANKVKFREDSSNPETKYTRNKIRHLVIPVLKEINPSIEATLNETTLRMSETRDIVNYFTDSILHNSITTARDGSIHFTLKNLHPFESNVTMLYEVFKPFGITGSNALDLKNVICGPSGGQVITTGFRLTKNRSELIITKAEAGDFTPLVASSQAALRKIPWIESVRKITVKPGVKIPGDPYTATLDLSMLKFPLTIRKWKKGDTFYPFGMKGKKKLSDYFIDRKIAVPEKEKMLVFESSGEIAWIAGERIDNRFRVTGDTKEALEIKISEKTYFLL